MRCMNIFKKPSLFTQNREESRGPLCWWNQKLLCQAPFFATPLHWSLISQLLPHFPSMPCRKGVRGPTFITQYNMLGVCLGIFPSLSYLILKASIIPSCVVEKMRLSEASPGYLSLLCVLRHLQSQSREAISYPADSWLSASSPDFHLLKHVDIFLSVSSLTSQQHLSGLTRPPPWLPWPHTAPLLPTSIWSFVGSSLSVGIPSTQLPFSYPAALSQWIRSTLLTLKAVCMLMTC